MGTILTAPPGPPALAALGRTIDELRHHDPLHPVTVVVPSPFAGLSLRRALARAGRPLVNVRFDSLAGLAGSIAARALAADGRPHLPAAVRAEAVRLALLRAGGRWAELARHPNGVRSAETSFRRLASLTPTARSTFAAGGRERRELCARYDEFRALVAGTVDAVDVLDTAIAALAGPPTDDAGIAVGFLPELPAPVELELVRALHRAGRFRAVVPVTGNRGVDALLGPLLAAVGALAPTTPGAIAGPDVTDVTAGAARAPELRVVHAPNPDEEVRWVARDLVARAESGMPLHRAAIVSRIASPYRRIVAEVFAEAGLAWNGPPATTDADRAAGRVLLGLLDLAAAPDLERAAVAAWLASGPVRDPDHDRAVPASRWDRISRQAGVTRGPDRWDERLGRLERELVDTRRQLVAAADDADPDGDAARRAELDDLTADTTRLRGFVAGLARRLAPPEHAAWTDLGAWAGALLDAYLRVGPDWPEPERDAVARTRAALDAVAALGSLGDDATLAVFAAAVRAELERPRERVGRFGVGAFFGAPREVVGTDFDIVYVLGMTEGRFPPRGEDDPLVPDEALGAAGVAACDRAGRRARERRDYLLAIATAPAVVCTLPRADPREQRAYLPSRFLLDTVHEIKGLRLGAAELFDSPHPWIEAVDSAESALAAGTVVSRRDARTRALLGWTRAGGDPGTHPLTVADPVLARGYAAIAGRAGPALSDWDGFVGAGDEPSSEPVSATALEDFARCPFHFLLAKRLGLRPVAAPEELDAVSALDRGSLVHTILERFASEVEPPAAPDHPWPSAARLRLDEIARECCQALEARGLTGRPVFWELERRRILRLVQSVLLDDDAQRGAMDLEPWHSELAFGEGPEAATGPVTIELPSGRTARFRGRVDRIDRAPDGSHVVVFDYKTGRSHAGGDADDPVAAGHRLQLPVYGLAAQALAPDAAVATYYWYVEETGKSRLDGVALDDATVERFTDVVDAIFTARADGVYVAVPGEPQWDPARRRDIGEHCRYCEFDRLCPRDRDDRWNELRADASVAPYRALEAGADPGSAA